MAEWCQWDGCEKPAMQGDHPYCSMHTKRQQRGTPMNAPEREILPLREAVAKAIEDYNDCGTEDDDDAKADRCLNRVIAASKRIDGSEAAMSMLDRSSIAREMGRKGGLKGGPARAAALNPAVRAMIARRAAEARWRRK
jgi:hypothetical protein